MPSTCQTHNKSSFFFADQFRKNLVLQQWMTCQKHGNQIKNSQGILELVASIMQNPRFRCSQHKKYRFSVQPIQEDPGNAWMDWGLIYMRSVPELQEKFKLVRKNSSHFFNGSIDDRPSITSSLYGIIDDRLPSRGSFYGIIDEMPPITASIYGNKRPGPFPATYPTILSISCHQ